VCSGSVAVADNFPSQDSAYNSRDSLPWTVLRPFPRFCAGDAGVSPESIDQVVFSNTGDLPQQLCLDNLVLLDGNTVL